MDRPRDELLAGTRFPGDQHRGVGRCHPRHLGEHRLQRLGDTDNLLEHRGRVDLLAQRQVLAEHPIGGGFPVVDVSGRGIQPDQGAAIIPQGLVTDGKPAILAIMTPDSGLPFLGATLGDRSLDAALHRLAVVRMIEPVAPLRRRHAFLERGAEIGCGGAVHQEHLSVWTDRANQMRHRIDHHPQFLLAVSDLLSGVALETVDASRLHERDRRLVGGDLQQQALHLGREVGPCGADHKGRHRMGQAQRQRDDRHGDVAAHPCDGSGVRWRSATEIRLQHPTELAGVGFRRRPFGEASPFFLGVIGGGPCP